MYEHLNGIWKEIAELIKRKKFEDARERVQREFEALCRHEVAARRQMVDELNRSIFEVTCLIANIERKWAHLLQECPTALEDSIRAYLVQLKKQRAAYEVQKRQVARSTMY